MFSLPSCRENEDLEPEAAELLRLMSSESDSDNEHTTPTFCDFLIEKGVEVAKTLIIEDRCDQRISLRSFLDRYGDRILARLWKKGYQKFPAFFVRSLARRLVSKQEVLIRIKRILYVKHDPPVSKALLEEVEDAYDTTRDLENDEDHEKFKRATAEMTRLAVTPVVDGDVRRQKKFAKHFCWACLDYFKCTEKTYDRNLFAPIQDCSCLEGAGVWFCSNKCWHLSLECFDGCQMYGTGWHPQDVERWIETAHARRREKDAAFFRRRERTREREREHHPFLRLSQVDRSSSSNSSGCSSSSSRSNSSSSSSSTSSSTSSILDGRSTTSSILDGRSGRVSGRQAEEDAAKCPSIIIDGSHRSPEISLGVFQLQSKDQDIRNKVHPFEGMAYFDRGGNLRPQERRLDDQSNPQRLQSLFSRRRSTQIRPVDAGISSTSSTSSMPEGSW